MKHRQPKREDWRMKPASRKITKVEIDCGNNMSIVFNKLGELTSDDLIRFDIPFNKEYARKLMDERYYLPTMALIPESEMSY